MDDGEAIYGNIVNNHKKEYYQYSSGVHIAEVTEDTYDTNRPRGIHVFMKKPKCDWGVVAVQCHVDNLVIMGRSDLRSQEAVLTLIRITKKDWKNKRMPTNRS